MIIRPAKESDYQEVMALYNAFVNDDRYSHYDNDSYKKVLANPLSFLFLAEDEGKIVGFASFSVRDVVRYPKPIVELDELFVALFARKKGVGRKLMQAVEEKAKDLHCYRLFIESHYDHKTAHTFYERLGYTNYGYHFVKDL